jgi:phosphoribosylaminoimidazole-succinocarboxamide synthase
MSLLPPLLYRGSVKNVRGEVSAKSLLFEFSERYSVFDWGEMPDHLDGKGIALSIMGKSFFKYLENSQNWCNLFDSKILNNHFDGQYLDTLKKSDLFKRYSEQGLNHHAILNDTEYPWNSAYLRVKNISVLRPELKSTNEYDYSIYKTRPVNVLVPLEIIFRLGLPEGNSLSKRMGTDLTRWRTFGFNDLPATGSFLKKPIIDFSTKLERGDRYLDYKEAKSISAMNDSEWDELQTMASLIGLNLFSFHSQMGLELWDGKIEVAFTENADGTRSFMLVDSIGIDELRLLYKGKSFSKEFLRETYKNSEWHNKLEDAKKLALKNGGDFRDICLNQLHSTPELLDIEVKTRAEAVYKSYTNAISAMINCELSFSSEYNLDAYAKRYL